MEVYEIVSVVSVVIALVSLYVSTNIKKSAKIQITTSERIKLYNEIHVWLNRQDFVDIFQSMIERNWYLLYNNLDEFELVKDKNITGHSGEGVRKLYVKVKNEITDMVIMPNVEVDNTEEKGINYNSRERVYISTKVQLLFNSIQKYSYNVLISDDISITLNKFHEVARDIAILILEHNNKLIHSFNKFNHIKVSNNYIANIWNEDIYKSLMTLKKVASKQLRQEIN
ncbi:hypothetical protein RI065_04315 [Mycoplasmatota bacterium zrk1]